MTSLTDTLPDLAALINRWQDDVAPMLAPNHCILAARVLTRLWPDRVDARDAGVLAANQLAQQTLPTLAPTQPLSVVPEAWTVGAGHIGVNPDPTMINNTTGGYDGHVVVLVDGRWLVDLSAPQMDRPHRGIRIRRPVVIDLAARPTPSFLRGADAYMWNLRDLDAGIGWIHYGIAPPPADPAYPRWGRAPDWRFADRADHVIARLNETAAP